LEPIREIYPFAAIVGQSAMKKGLLLNLVNPQLGGVLIRGEKGTAKSTAVRALAELMAEDDQRHRFVGGEVGRRQEVVPGNAVALPLLVINERDLGRAERVEVPEDRSSADAAGVGKCVSVVLLPPL